MPKVPGVAHDVMKKGQTVLIVPRNNPIKPHTMGALVRAAGLTVGEFRELLK